MKNEDGSRTAVPGADGPGKRGVTRRQFAARAGALGLSAVVAPRSLEQAFAQELRRAGDEGRSEFPSTRGMVVAPQPIAVEVGASMLRRGGNAIDAAIATAFSQFLETPHSCGIGGFGCMLIYSARERRTVMIDFHGRAGSKATPDVFTPFYEGRIYGHADRHKIEGDINQIGHKSVVIPGTVAGLYKAWEMFGTLPWAELIAPAIETALNGFELTRTLGSRSTSRGGVVGYYRKIQATDASARIYLKPNGDLWEAGDRLVQTDYGRSLQLIAEQGPDVVYRGEIAERIVEDFTSGGGFITREDLEEYRVDVHEPVRGTYRGHEIVSNPLPGSGPQVIEILNLLEGYDLPDMGHTDPRYVELIARAQKISFIDRVRYHGDPKFIDDPTELLMSRDRAAELRRYIDREEFPPEPAPNTPREQGTTTLCAVDEDGNCVALTHTLGSSSGVVTPGLGFTYNNCMFQFTPFPGLPNSIASGKARITGISPTIVFRRGQPILVTGASGGTRILGAVQHTINNVVDHGMSVSEALVAPRWHWEDITLDTEPRLYFKLKDYFEAKGITLTYNTSLASLQAIMIDPRTGELTGENDPGRRTGGVATA